MSKANTQSIYNQRTSIPHKPSLDLQETDFEEDYSDLEEYSGRRSEDSVGVNPLHYLAGLVLIVSSLDRLAKQRFPLMMSSEHLPHKQMASHHLLYRRRRVYP